MGIKQVLGVSRKTFFNPKAWVGYDLLKTQSSFIYSFVVSIIRPGNYTPNSATESFEDMLLRMNISEEELALRARSHLFSSFSFLFFVMLDFFYALYLIWHHHSISGFAISIATTIFLLTQAFKYNFWYFQIKKRKLECSFAEWRQEILYKLFKKI